MASGLAWCILYSLDPTGAEVAVYNHYVCYYQLKRHEKRTKTPTTFSLSR
jgi:hypothetical protein